MKWPSDDTLIDLAREHCIDFRWPSSALTIMRAAIAEVEKEIRMSKGETPTEFWNRLNAEERMRKGDPEPAPLYRDVPHVPKGKEVPAGAWGTRMNDLLLTGDFSEDEAKALVGSWGAPQVRTGDPEPAEFLQSAWENVKPQEKPSNVPPPGAWGKPK